MERDETELRAVVGEDGMSFLRSLLPRTNESVEDADPPRASDIVDRIQRAGLSSNRIVDLYRRSRRLDQLAALDQIRRYFEVRSVEPDWPSSDSLLADVSESASGGPAGVVRRHEAGIGEAAKLVQDYEPGLRWLDPKVMIYLAMAWGTLTHRDLPAQVVDSIRRRVGPHAADAAVAGHREWLTKSSQGRARTSSSADSRTPATRGLAQEHRWESVDLSRLNYVCEPDQVIEAVDTIWRSLSKRYETDGWEFDGMSANFAYEQLAADRVEMRRVGVLHKEVRFGVMRIPLRRRRT